MISLILCVYNMTREVPRTLHTLTKTYQQEFTGEYEVIVVENGSSERLTKEQVEAFGPEFRYIYFDEGKVSPVFAINHAVASAKGDIVCILNDGARMLSPGVIGNAERAFKIFPNAVVATLSWHLGPKVQMQSIKEGYCQEVEDELLESIPWQTDGYSLFTKSVLAGSSIKGWFISPAESNCVFMTKKTFYEIGGQDERFVSPGGGLIALDFFKNAWLNEAVQPVMILGEGTFHQVHGGIATNAPKEVQQERMKRMRDEYKSIRGVEYTSPDREPYYLGHLPKEALPFVKISADKLLDSQ